VAVAILTVLGGGVITSSAALAMALLGRQKATLGAASAAFLCMNAGAAVCAWADHEGHNLLAPVAAVSGILVGSICLEYIWSRRRPDLGSPEGEA
jgi:hypothetical protein